jgi:hypothetical protein
MNRRDLQTLAKIRLKEAQALARLRLYDGAYYLAGYAVECALKACIARRTSRYDFPDKGRSIGLTRITLETWSGRQDWATRPVSNAPMPSSTSAGGPCNYGQRRADMNAQLKPTQLA